MESEIRQKSVQKSKNHILTSRVFDVFNVTKSFPEVQKTGGCGIEEDIFLSFRGLLILGRVLGVIPICGVFKKSYRHLGANLISVPGISSIICILLLILNAILAVGDSVKEPKKSVYKIAQSIGGPLFACWGLFFYSYFMLRRHSFIKIFKEWAAISQTLVYTQSDTTLRTTIVLISVVMFASTILENAILHMEYFEAFDDINGHIAKYGKEQGNLPVVQMYYWRSHLYWGKYLGYHPILALLSFIVHKWILYGWNYVEVTSALFFRAMYFKFKALCKQAEESLVQAHPLESLDEYTSTEADRLAWEQLTKDHDALCDLVDVMNQFFSPILFVSYTVNIYFFCMQLLFGLNPEAVNHSIVHSIYAPWSFIHIVLRIFLLSLSASKVNEYAHKIRDVVMRCPTELYNGSVAKLDKRVNIGPQLGMTGLGCFLITKPFMLGLVNVVFTIEIVLLQGLATEQQDPSKDCKS